MVRTPLWTDHPEKMKRFGYDEATAVTPESVAKAMVEIVTQGKYPGGTSLEVSISGTRVLGTWNIEPPAAAGTNVPQEVMDENYAPLLAIMDRERSSR
jgi:hypothetical protein